MVVNRAKLAYDSLGAWLEGSGPAPEAVAKSTELEAQLWLQDRAASLLKQVRDRAGALEFETIEATAVGSDGKVTALAVTKKNRARDLIEDFMIAANVAIAKYLAEQQRSAIRRVVREPKRWGRIVELAAKYGVTLPAEPDQKALAAFLAARRAVLLQQEIRHQRHALLPLVEGREVRGEPLRQHRIDAHPRVHRRRVRERMPVERRPLRHQRIHVGDAEPHPKGAIRELLGHLHLVEVARLGVVDRAPEQGTQVPDTVRHLRWLQSLQLGLRRSVELRCEPAIDEGPVGNGIECGQGALC
jgi:hypothetical protein